MCTHRFWPVVEVLYECVRSGRWMFWPVVVAWGPHLQGPAPKITPKNGRRQPLWPQPSQSQPAPCFEGRRSHGNTPSDCFKPSRLHQTRILPQQHCAALVQPSRQLYILSALLASLHPTNPPAAGQRDQHRHPPQDPAPRGGHRYRRHGDRQ